MDWTTAPAVTSLLVMYAYTLPVVSSIRPLSAVSPTLVREYLLEKGQRSDVVDWKYFDSAFSVNHERGYVYLQNEKVAGFLGLIPFRINHDMPISAAWSCDWFRDETAPGMMAVRLLQESLRSYDMIYSLAGSEKTQAILPKLARQVVMDAGIVLHKPLRLGGIVKPLAQQRGLSLSRHLSKLNIIPTTTL